MPTLYKRGPLDSSRVLFLPVDSIQPNPYQPRQSFAQEDLDGLAQSIQALGLLQPLTVRRGAAGWELVAGERRLRARIACGEGALLPALRALQSVSRVQVERGGEPGVTQVVLTAREGAQIERELFTLLSGLQTPLLRLSPVEDSLEEIFLRATGSAD